MTNKMVRPIMTGEARDALDRMTANYELRSSGILEIERELNLGVRKIKGLEKLLESQKLATSFWSRCFDERANSRDYWLKVAGVSIIINWALIVYVVASKGWLL